ncbi:MAG: chemotaxis protein CheD [Chitinivorax sp.]
MPDATPEPHEIYLQPGGFHFGDEDTRIRTLLGSCVAITLWHPRLRIGGMCHYLLPDGGHRHRHPLDGRYARGAIGLFMHELARSGTRPADYVVKVFGGGRMFLSRPAHARFIDAMDIGQRNIEAGKKLLRDKGFTISAEHLAGDGHRNVIFDLATGDVWIRHVAELPTLPGRDTFPQGER